MSITDKENGLNEGDLENTKDNKDIENKKIPYPKSVFFILSNEICERFSYYGMRTILSLYLRDVLLFSESDSTIIYHLFAMSAYFFPLLGAYISDSWLGRYKTILYVSMIYAVGNILLALSATSEIGIPQVPFSMIALLLIAVGTGGIKPCVSSFGADQFILPQQELQLVAFFSVFYFAINSGSLVSTFVTPIIRKTQCFGSDCYLMAFAVPGGLMIISIFIFLLGSKFYKIKKPEGNILAEVFKCIIYAIRNKTKEPVDHWLDRSIPRFGEKFVDDIKQLLKVLVIFTPLPIFWSLYDQQGTRWTFQASRMNGVMGSFTLLPDQMQVVNPLLIMAFIPLFTYGVYPLCAKINFLTKPLERMVYGGFLSAVAFAISAGVAFVLEANDPNLPSYNDFQLRLYNPTDCDIKNFTVYDFETDVPKMEYVVHSFGALNNENLSLPYHFTNCDSQIVNGNLNFMESPGLFYYFNNDGLQGGKDDISKPEDGLPRVRTLISNSNDIITYKDKNGDKYLSLSSSNDSLFSFNPETYKIVELKTEITFKVGGVYTVLINVDKQTLTNIETTSPNSVHVLWLLPQYIIITLAEILISITGLEFSYSVAPATMKSVLTALFLLTSFFGNLLIVIIESIKIFDKQSSDFLLYVGLMVVDMIGFAFLAKGYKYRQNSEDNVQNETKEES